MIGLPRAASSLTYNPLQRFGRRIGRSGDPQSYLYNNRTKTQLAAKIAVIALFFKSRF
jgi:hypothetical protein